MSNKTGQSCTSQQFSVSYYFSGYSVSLAAEKENQTMIQKAILSRLENINSKVFVNLNILGRIKGKSKLRQRPFTGHKDARETLRACECRSCAPSHGD